MLLRTSLMRYEAPLFILVALGGLACHPRTPTSSAARVAATSLPVTRTFAPACEPVEVGPNKWITPMCGELPSVSVVPHVRKHGIAGAEVPLSVDLRSADGPVRDQGQVGVCWAFALSAVMDNGARRDGYTGAMVSSLHVVAKDAWGSMWGGRKGPPLTVEPLWPYDPPKACAFNDNPEEVWCEREYGVRPNSWRSNPQLVAELDQADRTHHFSFREVQHLEAKPANIEQLTSVLSEGQAIWAAFAFNRSAWSYAELRDGVFSDYTPDRAYGHAVELVGYRTVGFSKDFLLKNSWGTDWGHGGYAWMPEDMVRRHLQRAFRLRVVATREGLRPNLPVQLPNAGLPLPLPGWALPHLPSPAAWPVPAAVPAVAPAAVPALPTAVATWWSPVAVPRCAADQARDLVTGACVAACTSGHAPVFGLCAP